MRMPRAACVALAASAGLVAACNTNGIGYQSATFTCVHDADCGSGQVCQAGVCVPPGGSVGASATSSVVASSSATEGASTGGSSGATQGTSTGGVSVGAGSSGGEASGSTEMAGASSGSASSGGSSGGSTGGGASGLVFGPSSFAAGAALSEPETSAHFSNFGSLGSPGASVPMHSASFRAEGGFLTQ